MKAKEKTKKGLVEISDSDIATIEALHDLLLDKHKYSLEFPTLKKARELTAKMYKVLYPEYERHGEKYFDWADVPEGYDWVAIDPDGEIWAFRDKPRIYDFCWIHSGHKLPEYLGQTDEKIEHSDQLCFQRPTTEKP